MVDELEYYSRQFYDLFNIERRELLLYWEQYDGDGTLKHDWRFL